MGKSLRSKVKRAYRGLKAQALEDKETLHLQKLAQKQHAIAGFVQRESTAQEAGSDAGTGATHAMGMIADLEAGMDLPTVDEFGGIGGVGRSSKKVYSHGGFIPVTSFKPNHERPKLNVVHGPNAGKSGDEGEEEEEEEDDDQGVAEMEEEKPSAKSKAKSSELMDMELEQAVAKTMGRSKVLKSIRKQKKINKAKR
eukprot:CAMPEP_0184697196 /NCGR_PEP_ID=MMETSP0313-20130426/4234_1 /TAXON_ID=2792 /ORGANISM="Porphyridium aerugineum, Strain SAG 1380-2" /LENGTH=196 /DNA_ID=CAMNT_0027155959 /DNA_START=46 /DNA_END=633 /DNA_ORIENTATION=-